VSRTAYQERKSPREVGRGVGAQRLRRVRRGVRGDVGFQPQVELKGGVCMKSEKPNAECWFTRRKTLVGKGALTNTADSPIYILTQPDATRKKKSRPLGAHNAVPRNVRGKNPQQIRSLLKKKKKSRKPRRMPQHDGEWEWGKGESPTEESRSDIHKLKASPSIFSMKSEARSPRSGEAQGLGGGKERIYSENPKGGSLN